ncbi:hypothetical protein llap_30 [Limosa lapponica baueri]|uniref:Uncharacterized protein n=1 Tax=Limosa lapponica baueri TaxID=1758121 RepID=A0A2I0UUC5_LIMLA|nr:hypothetical protein llap_30 [Limosa lapponica baueri]
MREEGGRSPLASRQPVPALSKITAVNQKGIQTMGCERQKSYYDFNIRYIELWKKEKVAKQKQQNPRNLKEPNAIFIKM